MLKANLIDFLNTLPNEPGVYRMKDAAGTVIYVGKASNLKKRVRSYFQKQHESVKTNHLVMHIETIDVTVTRTEKEALLLESSLIKALKPKYNILMRDDKSYPYLKMRLDHPFPSLKMVRCKDKPTGKMYFGPYPNLYAVRETLNLIQKIFKLRNCNDVDFNSRTRPCLQYQLKRCTAPCTGLIEEKAYRALVNDACDFLSGKSQQILAALQTRMSDAANDLRYEEAAKLRDQIQQLRMVQEQQAIYAQEGCLDIVLVDIEKTPCIQWVSIRRGQMLDSQTFFPKVPDTLDSEDLREELFRSFVMRFYGDVPSRIPELILTDDVLEETAILEDILSEWRKKRCRIQTKARGVKARWLEFARHSLNSAHSSKEISENILKERYEALRLLLKRPSPLKRLVCFDISHTQGKETVASCVVFGENGPLKNDYRRFNLHLATPGDDYAAMREVVFRYFDGLPVSLWPDVILIDGGKGQVAEAQKSLEKYAQHHVLLGIVKGPDRKASQDHLWLQNEEVLLKLPAHDRALHLLQHLRDEAHRFAIQAHRKKRAKASLGSSLSDIPGVGPKRRHALLQYFGGLQALAKAPLDEILKVNGINEKLAKEIYQHFHQ